MNDAKSTITGLKAQECPGGGWTGQPADIERATVADCLAHGVCGCVYGDAVQQIERLRLVIVHEADCAEAADDEAMRRGHEIERLLRCVGMAMGCLDPESKNRDEALAWYRLFDAEMGREPRASLDANE